MPRASCTLPEYPLIQCEVRPTRLNRWTWAVGGQSDWADGPGRLGVSQTEQMVLGGWGSVRLNGWSWDVGGQSDWTGGPGSLGVSQTERMDLGGWGPVRLNRWSWEVGGGQTERMDLGGQGSVNLSPLFYLTKKRGNLRLTKQISHTTSARWLYGVILA